MLCFGEHELCTTLAAPHDGPFPCVYNFQESGNPAVDDLRQQVAELAGINLTNFFEEGRGAGGGGPTQGGKAKGKVRKMNLAILLRTEVVLHP